MQGPARQAQGRRLFTRQSVPWWACPEYELSFNDESQTFFPYDLIFACCQDDLDTYDTIDSLLKKTDGDLFAGFDVGRTRNTSELIA